MLFACRNREKTERVIANLGNLAPGCRFRACDLASMRSVNALVDRLASDHEAIDLVFLNAGVVASPFAITEEGSRLREKKLPRKATDETKAHEAWDRTEARLSLTPWRV